MIDSPASLSGWGPWGALIALVLVGAPTVAATDPWDQQSVTQLAAAFETKAKRARDASRSAPAVVQHANPDAELRFLDDIRLIEFEAAHLHNELRAGKGRAETRPVHARLSELVARVRKDEQGITVSMAVSRALASAQKALSALAPYYAAGE